MNDENAEYITRIVVEMDQVTKDWILELEQRYSCKSHRELFFLALKFMDETPFDKLPDELRGLVALKKGTVYPEDTVALRWMHIQRIQREIDSFNVRTTKDKEILVKMIETSRKLLSDHSKDKAAKMLKELQELKEVMENEP